VDLFEAMETARTMRWLKPDPVPDELIDKLLWAATRASNPNNLQAWDFVVVRDPEIRGAIAAAIAPGAGYVKALPDPDDASARQTLRGALHLIEAFVDLPAVIFICGQNIFPPEAPVESMMYSAMYSAAQNILLASRALGLGCAYTTMHIHNEPAIRKILEIPDDRHIGVTMPVGFPQRPFSPVKRRPMSEVVHHERW
jgi:nitroreductase